MNATPPSPSLSDFTPPLPATLVANLASLNIRSAPDLIFASPAELIGKLPAGSVTFTDLTHHIAHVTAAFAGPAITADKLVAELEPRARLQPVSSSGLPVLDELIGIGNNIGGAPGDRVIQISGASASGKTVRRQAPIIQPIPTVISGARTTHRSAPPHVPSSYCSTLARHHGQPGTSTPRLARISIQRPACPSKNHLLVPRSLVCCSLS
jgi:hypothetical protein